MESVLTPLVSTKEKTSGAKALIKSLIAEKVNIVFGYPGGAIMPVYDALFDFQTEVHHVLTRHEQGAVHAAQGFARATGEVGVVLATSGPGATNLITGIADAMVDSTPLVCITGQVGSQLLGSDAFQETDIISISMPVTKWNFQVTKAEELPEAIAKAFYIAKSGRPGPVLIDITKDAQFQDFEFSYSPCRTIRSYQPIPSLNLNQVKAAADLINLAQKPFVLFGQGVILGNAEQEFKSFIEKTGIPAAWTILGLSALPTEHPLNVGMLGMHGNYGPNKLTNECDVLIAIGMRFDDRVTGNLEKYAKQARIIHLDIDPAEINKNVKVEIPVLGDCKETLSELTKHVLLKSHREWLEKFRVLNAIEAEQVVKDELSPVEGPLKMGEVVDQINQITDGDAVLVTDVGQHQMMACRYTRFNQSKSNITSGGLGTMGFCLPAAIGAKLGAPSREVIAVIGDGGFQMTIQELGTVFQTQAAIKIVILNNNFLGMVRQWQQLFFDKRYSSTELMNPDFIKIGEGYGIKGATVEKREDLSNALKAMFAHEGSYLLEVKVGKEDNVFPMVPSGASVSDIRLA
ncbi:biosynthetic-type acetolactate synthase large subunit [Roseivirga misakiensis]|uniref:Acetolactate synthase n=1 Tax=Roseivirga misakiensis TaxID=1563681 RepID=A0A1E5SZD6_9BACT|nr:biosynthetic-type acetolactate synthase large subunit [Roseivirga misakiensis]OEK04488.1 acetolactate synthase, large subunit, biosynthetic type [Roseivirga misakiensis]